MGWNESWTGLRWLMLLFFGFLYMLAPYATFNVANMLTVERFYLPDLATLLPGAALRRGGHGGGLRPAANEKPTPGRQSPELTHCNLLPGVLQ